MCCVVLCCVALCSVVLCCVVLCCGVVCCPVLCSVLFCCVVLCCVMLCCVAKCCVMLRVCCMAWGGWVGVPYYCPAARTVGLHPDHGFKFSTIAIMDNVITGQHTDKNLQPLITCCVGNFRGGHLGTLVDGESRTYLCDLPHHSPPLMRPPWDMVWIRWD